MLYGTDKFAYENQRMHNSSNLKEEKLV